MFNEDTLAALLVVAVLYFGARAFVADRPKRFRVISGGKKMRKLLLVMFLGVTLASSANAASVWQALSFGVGGQGVWADEGDIPGFRELEAVGKGSMSLTPHVSLVGGVAYGVDRAYVRGSGGFRLTVTDAENPDFGIGVGVSRHYVSEPESGLDEAAAEAAIGWKPLVNSPFILTGLAVYGLDTNRRMFTVGLIWPFAKAGAQ